MKGAFAARLRSESVSWMANMSAGPVRTSLEPMSVVAVIRREVWGAGNDQVLYVVRTIGAAGLRAKHPHDFGRPCGRHCRVPGSEGLLTRLVKGVQATEPLTFMAMISVLVMAALLASFLPARRASRVDPMSALRQE
jgi:hypothetical protein